MQKENLFFLKISGYISEEESERFQQTLQLIFYQLPPECLYKSLSKDVFSPQQFHFYSLWKTEDALVDFKAGKEFSALKDVFASLGSFNNSISGKWAEIQMFELRQYDI